MTRPLVVALSILNATVTAVSLTLNFVLIHEYGKLLAAYGAEVKAHRETIRENDEYLQGLLKQMRENRKTLNTIMNGEHK